MESAYFGTRSGERTQLVMVHTRDMERSGHTCTSFSPSATLLTMSRRAALSGFGFFKYSAFRMSSSSLLQDVVVSVDAMLTCRLSRGKPKRCHGAKHVPAR